MASKIKVKKILKDNMNLIFIIGRLRGEIQKLRDEIKELKIKLMGKDCPVVEIKKCA